MKDIIKIVKSLEDSALLLKGVSKTIQNERKEQKESFLSMLLGTLGASLLGNIVIGKGAIAASHERGMNRAGEGIVRAGYGRLSLNSFKSKKKQKNNGFLMPPHPLTNFEIQKYYQNDSKFNGVYSRDNLPNKIKDGAYVINLDEYCDIGTHCVALYIKNNGVTYFDSFGVEHTPKEIKTFINNKNIKTNTFRIQAYDSIMRGYSCIGFINFMLAGKILTDFTNLFSPNDFKRNDDIILKYFMNNAYV